MELRQWCARCNPKIDLGRFMCFCTLRSKELYARNDTALFKLNASLLRNISCLAKGDCSETMLSCSRSAHWSTTPPSLQNSASRVEPGGTSYRAAFDPVEGRRLFRSAANISDMNSSIGRFAKAAAYNQISTKIYKRYRNLANCQSP